ncbi:MAG: DUF4367 domain-containing protein [Blautia sp.]|jgi:hypothetical protein
MDKMSGKVDENLKMDDWIKEEYLEEARLIEEAVLEKDDVLSDDEIDVDASFERLMFKMKARGIYPEDGPEADENVIPKTAPETESVPMEIHSEAPETEIKNDKKIIEIPEPIPEGVAEEGKETGKKANKGLRRVMRGFAKVAVVVLVAGGCIFGASMTSEANRNYVIDSFLMLVGKDVQVNVVSVKDRDVSSIDETDAIRTIEDTLGVSVPNFMYRPFDFNFSSYSMDEANFLVNMNYTYENKWNITLSILRATDDIANSLAFHGELIATIPIMCDEKIKVEVYKIQESSDKRASYLAKWNDEDVYYQLSGKLKEGELLQMLEQMEI